MGWIDRHGCWQPGPEDYSGVTFTPTAPVNYVAAECSGCALLRAENERLRACHEAELGVCQEYCEVVAELRAEIEELIKVVNLRTLTRTQP